MNPDQASDEIASLMQQWIRNERRLLRVRVGLIAVATTSATLALVLNVYAVHLCQ